MSANQIEIKPQSGRVPFVAQPYNESGVIINQEIWHRAIRLMPIFASIVRLRTIRENCSVTLSLQFSHETTESFRSLQEEPVPCHFSDDHFTLWTHFRLIVRLSCATCAAIFRIGWFPDSWACAFICLPCAWAPSIPASSCAPPRSWRGAQGSPHVEFMK
jgi:hypothetical protein